LTSIDIGSALVLLWGPASLGGFRDDASEAPDAHVALTVTSQGILSSKASTTSTGKRLVATVCLQVPLEIMTTNEVLFANVTLELAISQMGLNVRLDVLLATKAAEAASEETDPLAIFGIGARNELGDLIS
jgi:hypothetical protein